MIELTTTEKDLRIAAEALTNGLLVAFPTETVYGLGGDAFNASALARIFEAKQRPRFDPLIVHIADLSALERAAALDKLPAQNRRKAALLCASLMPGPLTLVLPKQAAVPDLATSALPSVAVRFPAHPVAQKLIRYSTGAVAAPSANPFGYLSPTRAEHVKDALGARVDFIIDGGACGIGVESTVLDMTEDPPRLLRPGGLPTEAVEALIGHIETALPPQSADAPHSPGQLKSHYAPKTPLFLHEKRNILELPCNSGDVFLFFDEKTQTEWLRRNPAADTSALYVLSHAADLHEQSREAAAALFDILHRIDAACPAAIHAQKAPPSPLSPALNDRLTRAAF
jgi:L-threonylcarbamoyladenylate synthase